MDSILGFELTSGLLSVLWLIVGVYAVVFIICFLINEKRKQDHQRYLELKIRAELGIDENFSNFSPEGFEAFIGNLFQRMGYETELTPRSHDYGIDVIAKNKQETVAIQVKLYSDGRNVGNREVQRVLGAMQFKNIQADRSILVTNQFFTKPAWHQADGNPIELWDRDTLTQVINKIFAPAMEEKPPKNLNAFNYLPKNAFFVTLALLAIAFLVNSFFAMGLPLNYAYVHHLQPADFTKISYDVAYCNNFDKFVWLNCIGNLSNASSSVCLPYKESTFADFDYFSACMNVFNTRCTRPTNSTETELEWISPIKSLLARSDYFKCMNYSDPNVCDTDVGRGHPDDCRAAMSIALKNKTICDSLPEKTGMPDICNAYFVFINPEKYRCESLPSPDSEYVGQNMSCYLNLAVLVNDVSVCPKSSLLYCADYLQKIYPSIELCNLLQAGESKYASSAKDCFERVKLLK
ncbi:MAG: restriction endonuclease [Candidatus Micrarchaeia archaeon]